MFNASLEHLMAPWIKHSELAINPDCLEAGTGGAKPSAMEAPSSGWPVFIVSVDHISFILLLFFAVTRSIVFVTALNVLLTHCAAVESLEELQLAGFLCILFLGGGGFSLLSSLEVSDSDLFQQSVQTKEVPLAMEQPFFG